MFHVNTALPFDILEAAGLQSIRCPTAFIARFSVFSIPVRELILRKALLYSKEMTVRINFILCLIGVLFTMEVSLKFSVPALA